MGCMEIDRFRATIETYYERGRDLPWRTPALQLDTNDWLDPYSILVSELMLQQTQVARVVPKYKQFLRELPTLAALSEAPLSLVLELWSGLGYNRRAKYLHDAARSLANQSLPWQPSDLTRLKGIGPNTAAAVCVYAFDQPYVFIHHFSPQVTKNSKQKNTGSDPAKIDDKVLIPLVEAAIDRSYPRKWYWALMDYGSELKRTVPNPSRASAHHTRQSAFAGSQRQLRGQVLRYLLATPRATRQQLSLAFRDERLGMVLEALVEEGLLMRTGRVFSIATSATMLQ